MDATVAAAAIGVGGTVIVGVAGFWANVRNTSKTTALTLRAVELAEQGQVTDRYSKAVEQLGSDKLDVRIGAVYALERVARDSPRDHPTIMEVLAAFIREHSREQWPPAEKGAEPPERTTRPDVQAAATVIGRRSSRHDSQRINLNAADFTRANLGRADLADANLTGANLLSANLTGAVLFTARLTDAFLTSADLTAAVLPDADLTGAKLFTANVTRAVLTGANLTRAVLEGAVLTGANLTGANLTGANLTRAGLTDVNLTRADLTRADLTRADLTDALWPPDVVTPEGWQRDTNSGRLKRADINSSGAPTDPAPVA